MHQHPVPSPPHPEDLARVSEVFKALSEPTRAQLVLLLPGGQRSVMRLVKALGQPQSTVSRHLALLRGADLVRTRREGPSVHHRLADTHVAQLVREAFSHAQHDRLGLPDHPAAETVKEHVR
ncbi:regulatory protein ArsR [Deinococcus aerius]|uniref:Regulatory protein ArsR n=2 Tax=Deinococcus TaxID=1298 RepID=A0A2I9CS87_9DEIO|nr:MULTISPECIES: metalloregulator ArsR/SmtB family transcription factor [Deinococcus]MBB5293656.1 DNA-binding transcriptional ArsR family regulator [Deinococcus metallilatus]QBY07366.1 transcriptional regulator [Deinococcus metallilatus]RXJ14839.1 transcriptional regulator [Deinococcus metallilatus]TLK30960.1 helix-turn-helix transcriptional regulator [Deinococcus metallilatus]GBF04464.1 regulatory protein ArsR [Deinococcus aerius]